jgi:hypothetical protein
MKHNKMTRMQNQVAECGRSQKTAELQTRTRTTMMMETMKTMTKALNLKSDNIRAMKRQFLVKTG